MFKVNSNNELHSEPFEFLPVTNTEAYVRGKVMILSSGALTAAAVDTDGVQEYIMECAGTGDGSTKVACQRITNNKNYEVDADNVATGTYVVGAAYTLNAGIDGITNTTTKGVFVIKKNLDSGGVIGYFRTVYNR